MRQLPVNKHLKLRASIYGEALREFIEAKRYKEYLKWIMTWPSAIYEIKQQVFLLSKELEKTKNRDLTIALRILLENDQRYFFLSSLPADKFVGIKMHSKYFCN